MTSCKGRPREDSWVAAIHASSDDIAPLGAGLIIDDQRVVACAHTVLIEGLPRREVWVSFPKAVDGSEQPHVVASVIVPDRVQLADLVVLVLAAPVPQGVAPAWLRCPIPADLVDQRWCAFGFPRGDFLGNEVAGAIRASLGYGWGRLDAESRYHVERGFSRGDFGRLITMVLDKIKEARPDKVEVKFGIKVSGEAKWLLTKPG